MTSQNHKTKVSFSVTNCICYDQRVLKMAEVVKGLGCDVIIIGRKRGLCCNSESVPYKTIRFKMLFKRGFLFYGFFNIRLFFFLLFHKYDLFVANDLDTLLPNFLVSKLKGIPMVYDSHEYFTELPEIQNRTFVKWVWTTIERMTFPYLKHVITVSEPIACNYEKAYGVRVNVVRNFSKNSDHIPSYSREELGISKTDLLLIIQGNGINIDKGAEELIEAIEISFRVSLLIVGSGDVIPKLRKYVENSGLGDRIKFIPTLSWEKLIRYTKSADIGMCIEKDTNLNYRYCLPNKFFDYISAGIPVIASALPETGKIINDYQFGIKIESVTPDNISRVLGYLLNNKDRLTELKINSILASKDLNWETESIKVIEFYNKVLICG